MGKERLSLEIRELREPSDYKRCQYIERKVWKFETRDLVSAEMLATSHRFGGLLLGAEIPGQGLIGFSFSLPAPWNRSRIQHSHMLAVLSPYRNQGVGFRLKLAQLQSARRQQIPLITWTFDPLESRNGHLNLNKLGVTIRRYYPQLYGETSSELHQGIGTDRFLAEWNVEAASPNDRPDSGQDQEETRPRVILTRRGSQGQRIPEEVDLKRQDPVLWVEVPLDIQALKGQNLDLAVQWRRQTRMAFSHYLSAGYEIRKMQRVVDERPGPRAFYRLEARHGL